MSNPVIQPWVCDLTYMQQSVLLTALRGPDGIHKDHVSKLLIRWLRRCVLISAFDRRALDTPYDLSERRGGSFTGPSCKPDPEDGTWWFPMFTVLEDYLRAVDELPHHFQLHFMHAAEIIGYKHPDADISKWWNTTYRRLANDMHLVPESEAQMDKRLGDNRTNWLAAEEVTAGHPGDEGRP